MMLVQHSSAQRVHIISYKSYLADCDCMLMSAAHMLKMLQVIIAALLL